MVRLVVFYSDDMDESQKEQESALQPQKLYIVAVRTRQIEKGTVQKVYFSSTKYFHRNLMLFHFIRLILY